VHVTVILGAYLWLWLVTGLVINDRERIGAHFWLHIADSWEDEIVVIRSIKCLFGRELLLG
jgi:hypothetical protein